MLHIHRFMLELLLHCYKLFFASLMIPLLSYIFLHCMHQLHIPILLSMFFPCFHPCLPSLPDSAKSSSGVSEIDLWNRKSCVNRCAIFFERSKATGSFHRYVQRFCRYLAMFSSIVCNYSAEDSRKSASCHEEIHGSPQVAARKFTDFRKVPCRISWKTYTANPRNSVTNLWHVR